MIKMRYITVAVLVVLSTAASSSTTDYNNEAIELLKNGEFITAITYLEYAQRTDPTSETIKKNLAIAYNNYGVQLLDEGKADRALKRFNEARDLYSDDKGFRANAAKAYNQLAIEALAEENFIVAENHLYTAIRLEPKETAIRKNLSVCLTKYGVTYYEKKEYELARGKFADAISFDETNATAHAYLGNTYYYTQDLQRAVASFQNALEHDPDMEYARERIDSLKKEMSVEGGFTNSKYNIFKILYNSKNGKVNIESIEQALWDAYYGIGSMFQHYTQHTVIVILYTPEEFKEIRDAPNWVAGLYDGKIRIPYPEGRSIEEVERIIRHEYTHVIINDLSDGKCINWLNEGLARTMEQLPGDKHSPSYRTLIQAYQEGTLIDLDDLDKNFIYTEDPKKAALAYEQSSTLVAFIIQRYGLYKCLKMIEDYTAGKTTEEVLKKEFYQDPDQFISDWKDYVREYILNP